MNFLIRRRFSTTTPIITTSAASLDVELADDPEIDQEAGSSQQDTKFTNHRFNQIGENLDNEDDRKLVEAIKVMSRAPPPIGKEEAITRRIGAARTTLGTTASTSSVTMTTTSKFQQPHQFLQGNNMYIGRTTLHTIFYRSLFFFPFVYWPYLCCLYWFPLYSIYQQISRVLHYTQQIIHCTVYAFYDTFYSFLFSCILFSVPTRIRFFRSQCSYFLLHLHITPPLVYTLKLLPFLHFSIFWLKVKLFSLINW